MFERGPFRMAVRVTWRDVKRIQHMGLFHKIVGYSYGGGEFPKKLCHHVPPGLLTYFEMKGLDPLFSRLMGREAGPLMASLLTRIPGLLQVPFCLIEPVVLASGHLRNILTPSGKPC